MIDEFTGHIEKTPKIKFRKNGDIKDVLVVALPMLLSMSFDTLMTFVDRLFLSRLGPAEMNASLGAGGMNLVLITFFTGMISYTTAMVAQRFGAGKKQECASVFMQAVYLSLACVPFLYLMIPLGHLIFEQQGLAADQLAYQKLYFNILMIGGIVSLVRNAAPCFFSGIGETKIIMKAAFAGMLVNIVCNYFLIFGVGPCPRLGVAGAAYGTVIGNIVSTVMLFVVYFGKRYHSLYGTRSNLKFNLAQVKELLKRGMPSGVEMFLNMAAFQLMILLFHGLGAEAATAASIMFNWDMVAYVPLMGLEVASTSLVGRYVGAKSAAAASRSTYSGLKVGWGYSLLIAVLLIFLPGVLADVFRPDVTASAEAIAIFESARPMGIFMLRFATLYIFVEVLLVVYCGALRGAGDTVWVMCACAVMNWFNTIALYVAAYIIKVPPHYAWIIVVCVYSTAPVLFYLRWKSGKWRRHVLDKN
ncbi:MULTISPECIES: MATE family efflux transporter [unclassified Fibrobacter]|uniref:MATE family efflux transporter n=1 Tax=unclassified Fibrobacter TaxID=2634177 RepID=UPI00091F0426|nr:MULTISPECIES: MATE family efflux transporter [Fibrobacter]MCL4101022.1 Multidrug resistance protein MdtK [Fibrobacter succinogenes]OWV06944.1 MATE family efflux transporter [Fibrobacter sp. UWH3]OWV16173.1 MATE family efflux transporter [Fibrobacter sp. UWH1]SHK22609.1 multidrug resistance protein, MATE family [Fibrobacter sp. UWH6]